MYTVFRSRRFEKSFRRLKKSGNLKAVVRTDLEGVITILAKGIVLPANYFDHQLKGEYASYRECHIKGDLLLLYRKDENKRIIAIMDIGT